jgi:16S rRNA (uracil1498-N3)-methyltransferase
MKQFILNDEPDKNNKIQLKGDDYRYLVRVRRLAAGEYFPALLPNGEETQVQILSIDDNILLGKCSSPSLVPQTNPCGKSFGTIPPIILFQALPKADKMDLIVRQAAEGGISEIIPFTSEFSIAKTNADGQKFIRWERIIKEARQQSGSKISTVLHKPLTMSELFDYWRKLKNESTQGLLFHHPTPAEIKNLSAEGLEQKSLHEYLINNPQIVVLVIGPEGGFSEKEVTLFLENNFKLLTIGDTILRTETAALYCAAAIRILLLERDSWELKHRN